MICTWPTWGMLQSWVDITMTKNTAHDGHIQLYMHWSIRRYWAGMLGMRVSGTVQKMHPKPPRETYQRICAEQVNNGNHTDGVNSNDMSRVLRSVTTQVMFHNPAHQTHQARKRTWRMMTCGTVAIIIGDSSTVCLTLYEALLWSTADVSLCASHALKRPRLTTWLTADMSNVLVNKRQEQAGNGVTPFTRYLSIIQHTQLTHTAC